MDTLICLVSVMLLLTMHQPHPSSALAAGYMSLFNHCSRSRACTYHPRRDDAQDDGAKAAVQPPHAVRRNHLACHLGGPLHATCSGCWCALEMPAQQVGELENARGGLEGWARTLRPAGAPSRAICRVFTTDRGNRQVVMPC